MSKRFRLLYNTLICLLLMVSGLFAAERASLVGSGEVYSAVELTFTGPVLSPQDTPARDIDFWVRFRNERSGHVYRIYGFWDGDGAGGNLGNVFKVRFCPTSAGRWILEEVHANVPALNGQRQGDYIRVSPSSRHGFWVVDSASAGRRWYRRSDGSHQYITGNTHYSFLSGYMHDGQPTGNDIARDIRGNARYFRKLRFGLSGDYYPDPKVKPFLDSLGHPTDWGDYSCRPNPTWFHNRVDLAVQTANVQDLIADLILAGPDTDKSRSTLRARYNQGDPTPFLKYIAARYGSYPNVWICLSNEYDIRIPSFTEEEIARFGKQIRAFLPYPTPLSVHATPHILWSSKFDQLPPWNDHQIIQKKLRSLAAAADVIQTVWQNPGSKKPRYKPTINDELSYQGAGDHHNEGDTIEALLGAFLGGGYGTTGSKPASKRGQYFRGRFNPKVHTAADNLKWFREIVDSQITFWKMAPDHIIFSNLPEGARGMAWPGHEYVLGTDRAHQQIVAQLPAGQWAVHRYDIIAEKQSLLTERATGRFVFNAPDSRAALFFFEKQQ